MHDVYVAAPAGQPWDEIITEVLAEEGAEVTPESVERRRAHIRANARETVSAAHFDPNAFDEAVVVSAEEVAAYWAALPDGTNMIDLLDVLAPPHDRLFVEFQRQPNTRNVDLHSWGVLIEGIRIAGERLKGGGPSPPTEVAADGWILEASLVFEFRKGEPVGPIAKWVVPLDVQGRATLGDAAGYGSIFTHPLEFVRSGSPTYLPQEDLFQFADALGPPFLGPALFAVSLTHCKNVDIQEVEPPERLSRSHSRRKGRPLTRYYVLDIWPMRRLLDREGDAQAKGLRHALHICRGHFKTYGPEAPLLGKHTGTYWWPSYVRGAAAEGVVEKDYQVRLDDGPAKSFDEGLGREYIEVDEHPEFQSTALEHSGRDPDVGGRGLRAHNATQNRLAQAVRNAGHVPRGPRPDEPQFDLAWVSGANVWVAEVKSITPQNEEGQLRMALGQVLRYQQLLGEAGRVVKAMIVTERESPQTRDGLLGTMLSWVGRRPT